MHRIWLHIHRYCFVIWSIIIMLRVHCILASGNAVCKIKFMFCTLLWYPSSWLHVFYALNTLVNTPSVSCVQLDTGQPLEGSQHCYSRCVSPGACAYHVSLVTWRKVIQSYGSILVSWSVLERCLISCFQQPLGSFQDMSILSSQL